MQPPSSRTIQIDGVSLTLDKLSALAHGKAQAAVTDAARRRLQASRTVVETAAAGDQPVYGINTGFGHLATVSIPASRLDDLQTNLVRSHCSGVGDPLPREVVRAAMALRANTLARGHSGVRPQVVEQLVSLLNHGIHPQIPSQGSVGASGDLAPLAHLALALIGEGTVERDGRLLPTSLVLAQSGLKPLQLKAKEGLALINGTQITTAVGAMAQERAQVLIRCADVAGAMTLESLKGSVKPFDARVQETRAHPGQAVVADNLRRLTAGSTIGASHAECDRVQDSYSLRCMPQVHGAFRDTLQHVQQVLTVEANSSTDNPLVFAETDEMVSCGNFHGAPAGYVMDFLAIVTTDLAAISERRLERLVNPALSDLPGFLSRDPGLQSGLMLVQVAAAALVSENKILSHPASVDTIPTSADKEDHVSMSTTAARKAFTIVENTGRVLAMELLAAAQALDFLSPLKPGPGVQAAHNSIRTVVATLEDDRPPAPSIAEIETLIGDGRLLQAVEASIGPLL